MRTHSLLRNIFLALALLMILPIGSVNAADEFSSSYDITYSVSGDGITEVSEDITLKNLTEKFFPSSFSLTLPGSEVSDIEAFDKQGKLEIETNQENSDTKLTVKFTNQQIIGIGKEYDFTLKFKDKGIARGLGKVWNINIPKISQQTQVESFNLSLSVPTSFGDPDYILPRPSKVSESGGRINLGFNGETLFQSGISAVFGTDLSFAFDASFDLTNNSIFPKFISIPIGVNSGNQKTFIENISPRPENTRVNEFGTTTAIFKLNPGDQEQVKVSGFIKTFLNPESKDLLNQNFIEIYQLENKFWSKNHPVIKAKLSEILEGKESFSKLQQGKEIDKFVSNFLKFDYSRIEKNDYSRLGSLTAINNPEKALTAEYVDLEIALLRAAGVPARQVIGFSLSQQGKPFAYQNSSLHSWVEVFNDEQGWVIADPAWENTTGGAGLFNFNDLNHLGLAYSDGTENFILPNKIETKVADNEVEEKKGAELDLKVDTEILSGFPAKAKIKINNLGNVAFPASELKIDTSKILLQRDQSEPSITLFEQTPEIPPFGNIEYDLTLKTGAIWHSYQDAFQVNFAGVSDTRIITVKPILSYKIFAVEMFGALTMIVLFYILVLLIHHKSLKG